MRKSITKFHLTLWLAMCSISAVFAADLPAELAAINGLKHPSENLYTAGQPQAEAFVALAQAGVRHGLTKMRPMVTRILSNQ